MNVRHTSIFLAIVAMVTALSMTVVPSAQAGPHGAQSLRQILNGKTVNEGNDDDTVPQNVGEMNVIWTNVSGADTQQADSAGPAADWQTDTGYHMSFTNFSEAIAGDTSGSGSKNTSL
ncbi:MAG: hypothetical protein ABEK50_06955, partial [bacterium]